MRAPSDRCQIRMSLCVFSFVSRLETLLELTTVRA